MPSALPPIWVVTADLALRETLQRVLGASGWRAQPTIADPTLPARCELDPPLLDDEAAGAAVSPVMCWQPMLWLVSDGLVPTGRMHR